MGFLLQSKFAALFAHFMGRTGLVVHRPRSYGDHRMSARRVLPESVTRSEAEHQHRIEGANKKRAARIARNIANEAAQGR